MITVTVGALRTLMILEGQQGMSETRTKFQPPGRLTFEEFLMLVSEHDTTDNAVDEYASLDPRWQSALPEVYAYWIEGSPSHLYTKNMGEVIGAFRDDWRLLDPGDREDDPDYDPPDAQPDDLVAYNSMGSYTLVWRDGKLLDPDNGWTEIRDGKEVPGTGRE